MINILDLEREVGSKGYKNNKEITAKVCQDVILMMISNSKLKRNVTIKGGVVIQSLSKNIRRATLDIDLDFIHFPINDEGINKFIETLNDNNDFNIKIIGRIKPLRHENYKGKNISVIISDKFGNNIQTTIDIGVHKYYFLEQNEYCFDVGLSNKSVSLLINSVEQMFTEKLKSLLRFNIASTRYKDIYDMYFLISRINNKKLINFIKVLIFNDKKSIYKDLPSMYDALNDIFHNEYYLSRLKSSNKNWLAIDEIIVLKELLNFLNNL